MSRHTQEVHKTKTFLITKFYTMFKYIKTQLVAFMGAFAAQINLADAWKIIDISLDSMNGIRTGLSPNIGLLQFLASDANRQASMFDLSDAQLIDQGNGKVYKVNRRFFPRLGQGASNNTRQYCPSGGQGAAIYSDSVSLGYDHVSELVTIDDGILRCIKEGKEEYVNKYTREVLRNFINQLGQKVATRVATGGFVGNFAKGGGAPYKNLPLYTANGLAINPTGEFIIAEDAVQAEITNDLVLFGGTLLSQYRKVRDIASGNDLGTDASLLDIQKAIFRDTNFATASGNADNVLAMVPGALQLVTYNRHKSNFVHEFPDHMRTTTVDPWLGIELDVIMNYQKCGAEIKMTMQFAVVWDVVGYPECWSEDADFAGVTDVYGYKAVCADTGVCAIPKAAGTATATGNATDDFCESAEPCDLLAEFSIFTFLDNNTNNDTKDAPESALANIKVQIYSDQAMTTLVGEAVSDVNGLSAFALESGVYYLKYDTAFGAAVGKQVTTDIPKVIIISDNLAVSYPLWTEAAKLPIGPVNP